MPAKSSAAPKAKAKAKTKAKAKATGSVASRPKPPSRFGGFGDYIDAITDLHLRRPTGSCMNQLEVVQEAEGVEVDVDSLEKKVASARELSAVTSLSDDELRAVIAYTHEAAQRESSLYFVLNRHLRSLHKARQDADKTTGLPKGSTWEGYLFYLVRALVKLAGPAIVYRGFSSGGAKLSDYEQGTTGQWVALSSTSTEIDVARSFIGTGGTLFEIEASHGAMLPAGVSFYDEEREVLLPPLFEFEVLQAQHASDDGVRLVRLKQVVPQVEVGEDTVDIRTRTNAEKGRKSATAPRKRKATCRVDEDDHEPLLQAVARAASSAVAKHGGRKRSKKSDDDLVAAILGKM
jgi:hypothetical protein